ISLGDFVLTGGELPAMAVADAVCRMVPGVLADEVCFTDESHWDGLLEYPQYTKPAVWNDLPVPDILLSGHHGNIDTWRRKQSLMRTKQRRPDLFAQFEPADKRDRRLLEEIAAASSEE
ncbi:MAG: tRNA (guanosine(37)-N1)-methyltransferase TrmD, partial [Clostridiales bacterium]|nr:tRNA (guanosine(37)-N1)-methyltransferase TrmD [Clostridiales bacterium]